MQTDPADIVLRFLESVGRPDEAKAYLGRFRAAPREQFAVISIEPNVARDALEAVILDLRFLVGLGLVPVVVLGLRETSGTFRHADRIQQRLARAGTGAVFLQAGDGSLYRKVTDAARAGFVPLIAFGGESATGSDGRLKRLGGLISALRTRKLIFLHRRGGLLRDGALVPMLALAEEAEVPERTLRSASPRQKQIVAHARVLLFELVQHELLISLTSPLNLFRELFTVKGAGTLLKKRPPIRCYPDWNQVDHARLAELMVSSFGGVPSPEFLRRPVRRVYMEAQYRGAAVLCDTPVTTYLSKLAVAREAQGEGLGGDLWETLIADEPALFWRARARNPTTDWYVKVCDGLARFPDWTVFWKGLEPGKIPTAIAHALAQPVDIVPVDASRPVDSMRIG